MALVALGIFYGGIMTGVPVVTGVAEGVSHQKEQNKEAANETRMAKFYMDCYCEPGSDAAKEISGMGVVLRGDRVWLCPLDPETKAPLAQTTSSTPPHPFTGFYIQYPDEDRFPPQRGLVSTISVDPPMLNWIYVDKPSLALRYGNRTTSIAHTVGSWDWTEDESGVTLEGWEGFAAVEVDESEQVDGLKWALFYDIDDNKLDSGKRVGGRKVLPISLERRILPEELIKREEEEVEKKLSVKTSGDMKTKWG